MLKYVLFDLSLAITNLLMVHSHQILTSIKDILFVSPSVFR